MQLQQNKYEVLTHIPTNNQPLRDTILLDKYS